MVARDPIAELRDLNPEALTADGFDDAIIGYSVSTIRPHIVIYDVDKCIQILMDRDGMTRDEAEEYLSFNTLCAWVGENTPMYVKVTG